MNVNNYSDYFNFEIKYEAFDSEKKLTQSDFVKDAFNLDLYAAELVKGVDSLKEVSVKPVDKNLEALQKYVQELKMQAAIDRELKCTIVVSFNQEAIINDKGLGTDLKRIVLRFDGLCDLICNKVLLEGLLDRDVGYVNLLKQEITKEALANPEILKSHILDVSSVLEKIVAFLFGVYPDNIFSKAEQSKLVVNNAGVNEVNKDVLGHGLDDLEAGSVVKVEVFRKTLISFSGHSLLIKKVSATEYIFFDPNKGVSRKLSLDELSNKLNLHLAQWNANDVYIVKGQDFINRLVRKKVLKVAKESIGEE